MLTTTAGQLMDTVSQDGKAERRAVLLSIVGFWGLHHLLLSARMLFLEGEFDHGDVALRRLPVTLLACLLCYGIYLVLRRLRRQPFWQTIVAAGLLTIPAAALYGVLTDVIFYYVNPLPTEEPIQPYELRMVGYAVFPWLGSFFSWAVLFLALTYSFDVRERERRLSAMQALAHSAQVQALRYQINPHFLFNTLNAISSLIWEGELEKAETMLIGLSNFLRTTLELDPHEDVTLAEEIALQRLYLEIEQARFPTRLKVDIDVPPELAEARVPSLILQPLVENAIKYGVAPSKTETRVRISARNEDRQLLLEVADSGTGQRGAVEAGTGLGLRNVRERLLSRFGEQCQFQAGNDDQHGFRVRLGMPLQFI